MKLPEKIDIKNTQHGHGDKGMAFYTYEDAQGIGFVMDARRANRREPFVEKWRFRWLPDQTFSNWKDVTDAVRALPDEAVAAEKAKWPVLREAVHERSVVSGSCWLHNDRPATHSGYLQTCWIESAGEMALVCEECAMQAAADPMVLHRASEKRRADVAARKLP